MAFIGMTLPLQTARLLGQVKVEGEKQDLSSFHITVLYLGKNLPIEDVAKATQVAYEVTSKTKPFTVSTNLVSSFPVNKDDGIPIIARVEGDALHELRKALLAAFDAAGVRYDNKYPEYKPHVTLAYKKAIPDDHSGVKAPPDQEIPMVEWGIGEMVLWGGDRGDEKLSVTFPFALTLSKAAKYRAFVRLACASKSTGQAEAGGCTCGGSCSCKAQKVVARFDRTRSGASTPVDPKKVITKLLSGAEKELKTYVGSLPGAQANIWPKVEEIPGRGGYPSRWMGDLTFYAGVEGVSESLNYSVRISMGDDGVVGIGTSSGPHVLNTLTSRGTTKDAPLRLRKVLDFLKESLGRLAEKAKPKATSALTIKEVSSKLKRMDLGRVGGRVLSVETYDGGDGGWSVEPTNRQRLDHYGNGGEGWDTEGWEQDYARPIREAANAWLDRTFGKGLLMVDVGEKGYVDVLTTPAGRKALGQ